MDVLGTDRKREIFHLQEFKVHFAVACQTFALSRPVPVARAGSGCCKMAQQMEAKLWPCGKCTRRRVPLPLQAATGFNLFCAPNFRKDNANPQKWECLP